MLKAISALVLGSALLAIPLVSYAEPNTTDNAVQLRTTNSYTVKAGDTLWGIAGHFLVHPWQWPLVWHKNPYIRNPNLIYPGNLLKIYTNNAGNVRITVANSNTVVLEPKLETKAIPTVHSNVVATYLRVGYTIQSKEKYEHLPILYAAKSGHLAYYTGDTLYINNVHHLATQHQYAIVKLGHRLSTYTTRKPLGYSLRVLGTGNITHTGAHPTLLVLSAKHEISLGDRLIPIKKDVSPHYFPSEPNRNIHGHIISAMTGVPELSVGQPVIIDRGFKAGLQNGNVLRITDKHTIGLSDNSKTPLPRKNIGYLLIFKAQPNLAYGVITEAKRGIHIGDVVHTPK